MNEKLKFALEAIPYFDAFQPKFWIDAMELLKDYELTEEDWGTIQYVISRKMWLGSFRDFNIPNDILYNNGIGLKLKYHNNELILIQIYDELTNESIFTMERTV